MGMVDRLLFLMFFGALPIALPCVGAAEELLRPRTHLDLEDPTFELGREVIGAEVAWLNRAALNRDFPDLRPLSDEKVKAWLLENVSYVGSQQTRLDGLRNSPIPTGERKKPIFRPPGYSRSGVFEVSDPNQKSRLIGLIDVKGLGHGAESGYAVDDQIKDWNSEKETVEKIRIRDHSDGLMSLGEAIAEASRQQAAQLLFDLNGLALETVETYAVIRWPFEILKDNEAIPAGACVRQVHRGRLSGLNVPVGLYVDDFGVFQRTHQQTAVDFGGVVLTSLDAGSLAEVGEVSNPQMTKAWRFGHEVAKAYTRSVDPDKQAVVRHLDEMLGELQKKVEQSEVAEKKAVEREGLRQFVRFLDRKFARFEDVEKFYLHRQRDITDEVARLELALQSDDFKVRMSAARDMVGNHHLQIYPLIEKALADKQYGVRVAAVHALSGRNDGYSLKLIKRALEDASSAVRWKAAEALGGRQDAESLPVIEKILMDPRVEMRSKAARALKGRPESSVVGLIAKSLDDEHLDVVTAAATALVGRPEPEVLPLIEKALATQDRPVVFAAIEALRGRDDALPVIQKLIEVSTGDVQWRAVSALAARRDTASFDLLRQIFSSTDLNLKQEALFALAGREDIESKKIMAGFLKRFSTGTVSSGKRLGRKEYQLFKSCAELMRAEGQ